MKQIIPFTKDITFKTKVFEITSISLDHDLQLKGEDVITGNFYVKGKFKMTKASQIEEGFNYKIPCEINISKEYDAYDAIIDIDDFYYDLLDEEILKVNIAVVIDNLVKKEIEEEQEIIEEKRITEDNIIFSYDEEKENDNIKEEIKTEMLVKEEIREVNPFEVLKETKENIFEEKEDTYSTYYVYLVKEEDSFESITEKYKVRKDDILEYNDFTTLQAGIKLIIPEKKYE